jgi:tetratricopeptide (TPR) repeat protein
MPGNRALYDRAMEQSREAARQKQWDEALKQAARALQEFPEDIDARSSAAVALYNTGKSTQALQVFTELRNSDAKNPFFLEYIARLHEQTGDINAAIQDYNTLAELQQSRRLVAKVIEAVREIVRLRPNDQSQRLRLAKLLDENGVAGEATTLYLTLARHFQGAGNIPKAAEHADSAMRLDPNSREAKELVMVLQQALADANLQSPVGEDAPRLPSGMSGMLSGTGSLRANQIAFDRLVKQAHDAQESGNLPEAVELYERAIGMGVERSDVFYSLGLLYQENGNHKKAIPLLERASEDGEYALSAHYSLGASHEALGQLQQAAQEYESTLRLVDLETIGKAESDDLIQMYESTASIYTQMNDIARAASLYSSLANFLASKRWGKDRADEFRTKAKELTERNMFAKLRLMGTGMLSNAPVAEEEPATQAEPMPNTWGKIRPITDFLRPERASESSSVDIFGAAPTPPPPADPLTMLERMLVPEKPKFAPVIKLNTAGLDERLERLILASEKFIDQGLMVAANDVCHEVIRLNPDYLPIHLRLGEVYERDGRTTEALTKYQLLVDTYVARGTPQEAIDVYYRLIELSPDSLNARSRLADILRTNNRIEEAAEQVTVIASTTFRMGQTTKALEEYRRALQWAPNNARLRGQYGQALLKLERYEAALSELRRAFELNQSDSVGIARINMALALMGERPATIWQSLATLLDRIKAEPQVFNEITSEYRNVLLTADHPMLHYILGVLEQTSQQHQSALLELEQAEALLDDAEDPSLPRVLVHQAMADSYIALGQAHEALDQLKKGQAVANQAPPLPTGMPRYAFATPLSQGDLVRRMAEAFAATDDLEGAERALQEAKQHLPYDRAIYTKLADVYFRQGKLNEALTQLEELATYYENRQDLDRALETLDYGLKLSPNHIPIGRRLAEMNLRRGYLDQGVDGLVRVAELQRKANQLKDAVASLQKAAEVHWTLSQHDKAREIYDKIVKIAPNDLEARQWLSFMYTLAGRTQDAVAEKKQMVRIYLQQRDYDGAIAELHQIYGLDQNDSDTLFQLGDTLMRREEYGQALRTYQRLAKMPNIDHDRVEALQSAAKRMFDQQQARQKGIPDA